MYRSAFCELFLRGGQSFVKLFFTVGLISEWNVVFLKGVGLVLAEKRIYF